MFMFIFIFYMKWIEISKNTILTERNIKGIFELTLFLVPYQRVYRNYSTNLDAPYLDSLV